VFNPQDGQQGCQHYHLAPGRVGSAVAEPCPSTSAVSQLICQNRPITANGPRPNLSGPGLWFRNSKMEDMECLTKSRQKFSVGNDRKSLASL
jgi:hypothetical protein